MPALRHALRAALLVATALPATVPAGDAHPYSHAAIAAIADASAADGAAADATEPRCHQPGLPIGDYFGLAFDRYTWYRQHPYLPRWYGDSRWLSFDPRYRD